MSVLSEKKDTYACLPKLVPEPTDTPCLPVLQRFRWAAGLAFVSHGVRIGLRVNDLAQEAGLGERVCEHLPPASCPAESPEVEILYSWVTVADRSRASPGYSHFLYRGSCRLAHSRDIGEIFQWWESDLHAGIAAHSPERLFVHAGVVGWNGRAVLIPGRSFSGKTTLVAALIRAGATYLSDEYAVLGADGLVYPYTKALSLRDGQGRFLGLKSAEMLGGFTETGLLPVGWVLCCRYEKDACWRPRRLVPGRALLTLLDNTVSVRQQPQKTLEILRDVVTASDAFGGKRGEADGVVAWLQARESVKRLETHVGGAQNLISPFALASRQEPVLTN